MVLFGAIESGGTKWVCLVGHGPGQIVDETRFPTTDPDRTLQSAIDFFLPYHQTEGLAAIGIGSFGPVDLDPESTTYGSITTTPKKGWAWVDVAGRIRQVFQTPVAFDTDVNAAGYGEYRWGAAKDCDPSIYITIGTGIGGGGVFNSRLMHGLIHPEFGHIRLPHDRQMDPFPGICPYHGDCFEGLASGPAMKARWGQPAETLPPDHPGWVLEAEYISLALQTFLCTLSPRRVVLGGGVMQNRDLFSLIWRRVGELLNGYVQSPVILDDIQNYIIPPGLGNKAGVLGALAMAMDLAA